jgi:hypothetical protein
LETSGYNNNNNNNNNYYYYYYYCRILTNREIYVIVKKPTIAETIRLHRLRWFEHVQRMEENRIPKRVLYMNLESTRSRGRARNIWQDEVREDGRIADGEEWQ